MRKLEFTVCFHSFSLLFFSNCNLSRLRNVPTKFGDAELNGGKDMLKMGKNAEIGIQVCFSFVFFVFLKL
jgi:hypothetical protein